MKIAFDEQIFAQQEYGGISRYIVRLAEHLSKEFSVKVLAPAHINAYLSDLPSSIVFGQRVPQRRGFGRVAGIINRALKPVLLKAYAPDIVHETYYSKWNPPASRARRVLTVYDMIHEKFPADFSAGDDTARRKKIAVDRADHICCISQSTRQDLIALYPSAEAKSTVTLLGFDPIVVAPDCKPLIKKRPYLLFVGQRAAYKNFTGLLEAYAASQALRSDFDLVAVGGGSFQAAEIEAIHRHGLDGSVRQVVADDQALRRWYRGASVFIYPSLYEGFGIPPLEAMAAGTPVVAINVSSVPEICGDAAAYAEAGDVDALRNAIETVVFSDETSAALRRAGSLRLERFSWQKCAQQTAAVYRGLA